MVPENVPDNHLTAIKNNAEKMGIPLSIYVRVINHESRFDSSATNSSSGAMGYMQLMPGTFRHFYDVLSLRGGNTALNNLMCGSRLLKQNYDYWYKRKNNQEEAWQMALACYAMGDSLPRALGRVPESVKGYVNYVMQNENF
jgi:soluble lytic murein transglycosylase-like protein